MGKKTFIDEMIEGFPSTDDALKALRADMNLRPIDARLNLQVFLNALGREEESFEIANQLSKLAPNDPRVLFNRGWHMLKRGHLREGLSLLEHGRSLNTYGHSPFGSNRPIWSVAKGRGQIVHLALEGGLGDQLIHFRFAKDLVEKHECKVNIVCDPALAPFLSRQKYVSAVMQREAACGVYHDSWIPGMSAALHLEYEYNDISGEPYVVANAARAAQWKSILNTNKLRVGIRWAGNQAFEHQQLRRFPTELVTDLRKNPNVQLYSFQRDDSLISLPPEIIDLGPHLK